MSEKVRYEELLPHEFLGRLAKNPIGYLPLGTLEWHGPHNALGADGIQSRGLFERAAGLFGGIVLPPLWVGPDRIRLEQDGNYFIGMDYADVTEPNRPLPGSCYWVPKGLFALQVEALLSQCKRAGFRCIVADGHGPSRIAWSEMADSWERQFGLILVSSIRDFPEGGWLTQNDHAAKNETSLMLAIRPDLVDMGQLPPDRNVWPVGVEGEDPRDSSAGYGKELLDETLKALGSKLKALGF